METNKQENVTFRGAYHANTEVKYKYLNIVVDCSTGVSHTHTHTHVLLHSSVAPFQLFPSDRQTGRQADRQLLM